MFFVVFLFFGGGLFVFVVWVFCGFLVGLFCVGVCGWWRSGGDSGGGVAWLLINLVLLVYIYQ